MIGCGTIGRVHAERLAGDRRCQLVVACDPNPAAARSLCASLAPTAAIETATSQAIANHSLDAVVLCSPTQLHFEQAMFALEKGCHVLCEKPLATSRQQILDLSEMSRGAGRILSVAYQRRYQALYLTARRELLERSDLYGPVQQIHVFVCERWRQTIGGTWRDDPAVGAGYFGDAGSHQIDSCWFITSLEPESVFAMSDRRGARVEIVTQVLAKLSGGAALNAHFVGDAQHWREDIHFHCANADLELRNGELVRYRENQAEPVVDLLPDGTPDAAFLEAIVSQRTVHSPAECALLMYDWTAAVMDSIRSGEWRAIRSPADFDQR